MAGFDSIFNEVSARLGNRNGIDARIAQWINDAYFELLLSPKFRFHELERSSSLTTEVGVIAYELPTDLWHILNLRDETNGREIRRNDWINLDRRRNTDGTPNKYTRFGTTIELDPTPDSIITMVLRYKVRPAELVSGGTPIFGREWDEILITMATTKGFDALEQTAQAMQQRQLLEAILAPRMDLLELEDPSAEIAMQPRLT